MAKYRGHDDSHGPVTLMVIPSDVPAEFRPHAGAPTPPAVALVDVLGSTDARARHLATELLAQAAGRFRGTGPG
jgi:hypothetical protein